jgi:hypothetical protein
MSRQKNMLEKQLGNKNKLQRIIYDQFSKNIQTE